MYSGVFERCLEDAARLRSLQDQNDGKRHAVCLGVDLEVVQNVGGTSDSIEQILKEVDRDGDGRINYEEFVHMMRAGESTPPGVSKLRSAKSRRRAF